MKLVRSQQLEVVLAPATDAHTPVEQQSASRHHGDFDDDELTVKATLARILGTGKSKQALGKTPVEKTFRHNAKSLQRLWHDLPTPADAQLA